MITDGINYVYPTPVYKTTLDLSLNEELLAGLMAINDTSVQSDNTNIFNLLDPIIDKFEETVTEKFSEFFKIVLNKNLNDFDSYYQGWITGNNSGYSMNYHNHAGAPFVSVFYLYAEDTNAGGELVLFDPRVNANRGYLKEFQDPFSPVEFTPKTGDVLIFPGYLYHSVNLFSSKLRFAVPVDIFIKGRKDC
jgi:hypothetical protein